MSARPRRPELSVVVPTFNRRSRLERLLTGLERESTELPFEVVVIVDGSTDGTDEMLSSLQTSYRLRWEREVQAGPAAARNRGVGLAVADVVLFLDDDVDVSSGLLARHLLAHRDASDVVLIGPMLAPVGRRLPAWLRWEAASLQRHYERMANGDWPPTPRQFFTANASVRREHILAVGGFDERFRRAEDVEFAYRLEARGLRFRFDPVAAVFHEPDRSFESWRRVPYDYGRYAVLISRTSAPGYLRIARRERDERNPLTRVLTEVCVGRRWPSETAGALLAAVVRVPAPEPAMALKLAACSALFELRFWQGVADGLGAGTEMWRLVAAPSRPSEAAPHAALR